MAKGKNNPAIKAVETTPAQTITNAKKGSKPKSVKLPIVNISTRENKYGKFTVKTNPSEYNKKGVFQFTTKHLDKLADDLRATNSDVLADAIAASLEDCMLEFQVQWVEVGQAVIDDETGEEVEDDNADDGILRYTVAHWRINTTSFIIVLSDDAKDYIAELNARVNEKAIMEARNRRSRHAAPAKVVKPTVKVEEEDDEDEDLEE